MKTKILHGGRSAGKQVEYQNATESHIAITDSVVARIKRLEIGSVWREPLSTHHVLIKPSARGLIRLFGMHGSYFAYLNHLDALVNGATLFREAVKTAQKA